MILDMKFVRTKVFIYFYVNNFTHKYIFAVIRSPLINVVSMGRGFDPRLGYFM
jgi:hypothetical protein